MRRLVRFFLIVFSGIVAIGSLLLFLQVMNPIWGVDFIELLQHISRNPMASLLAYIILITLFILSVASIVYALSTGRLAKSRVVTTEIGEIDIGVEALENIALNSSKAAQAGVKSAKARISQNKEQKLLIILIVVLYSDVEIPSQMAKIQDRVKKDIERYTGIPVGEVQVKVNRVELIGAKVEHSL